MTEPTASPHPLQAVFDLAIDQVTQGKGEERHGLGADFMAQPWLRNAKTHGRGFLTGQAAKKLEEAQSFADPDKWEREMLGAIVYAGMAVLFSRMQRATEVPVADENAEMGAALRRFGIQPDETLAVHPLSKADPLGHILYDGTEDAVPGNICDRNGQVVLSLCKRCGRAESQLEAPCFPAEQLVGFGPWQRVDLWMEAPHPDAEVAVHAYHGQVQSGRVRGFHWRRVANYALRLPSTDVK